MVFGFLRRKKKEEELPDFGPIDDPTAQPLPPPPQQTPQFPTPGSTVVVEQPKPSQDSDMMRLLDEIKHKIELLDQKMDKIEQTLDFMQRYVYANR
jgi:hypothetical protein